MKEFQIVISSNIMANNKYMIWNSVESPQLNKVRLFRIQPRTPSHTEYLCRSLIELIGDMGTLLSTILVGLRNLLASLQTSGSGVTR